MSFVSMSLNQLRIMSSHLAIWSKKTLWNHSCGFPCVSSDSRWHSIFVERASGPINSSSKNKRIHQAKPISLKSSELNQLQGFVLLKHGTLPWSGGKPSADRWKLQSLRGCFCLTFYWLWHPIELLQDSLFRWLSTYPAATSSRKHCSWLKVPCKSIFWTYEPWRTSTEKKYG